MDDIKQRIIYILQNKAEECAYLLRIASYIEDGKEISEFKLKGTARKICIIKTLFKLNNLYEIEVFQEENTILKFTYDSNGEECISNDLFYSPGDWEYEFY